jgi:hypothetical protein
MSAVVGPYWPALAVVTVGLCWPVLAVVGPVAKEEIEHRKLVEHAYKWSYACSSQKKYGKKTYLRSK